MRYSLFSILSIVAAIALVVFIVIIFRSYIEGHREGLIEADKEKKSTLATIGQTLKIAGRLLKTRNILLLLIVFVYTGKYFDEFVSFFKSLFIQGLASAFIGLVYGTSIGHYKKYGGKNRIFFFKLIFI
jgi:hypothetical protein